MMRARSAIFIAVCLIAGMLTSQLVGIVIAGRQSDLGTPLTPETPPALVEELWALAPSNWRAAVPVEEVGGGMRDHAGLQFAWVMVPNEGRVEGGTAIFLISRLDIGWPLPSARSTMVMPALAPQGTLTWSGAWVLEKDWLVLKADTVIPYVPIWSGLAINTLFYGAILWLVIRGWSAGRRRRESSVVS